MVDSNEGPGGGSDGTQTGHHYDSFVVRLWSRGDDARFVRAELRHVQADAVVTGTHVAPEWVAVEIRRFLALHQEP